MNGWIVRAGVVGAVVSALGLSMPITAAHATSLSPALHIYAANRTNAGQAGYLVSAPASASVVDHFTVPSVTCNANVESAMGLGSIIFISSGAPDAANVIPYRPGGGSSTPIYYGGFLVAGSLTFTSFSPAPGDAIRDHGEPNRHQHKTDTQGHHKEEIPVHNERGWC